MEEIQGALSKIEPGWNEYGSVVARANILVERAYHF